MIVQDALRVTKYCSTEYFKRVTHFNKTSKALGIKDDFLGDQSN